MLVKDEINLIAYCLFKQGSCYQYGTKQIYLMEGTEVDSGKAGYLVHSLKDARDFAKKVYCQAAQ